MNYRLRHDCYRPRFAGNFSDRDNAMDEKIQPREFQFQDVLSALQPTIEVAWERATRNFQLNIGEANLIVYSSQNSTSAKSARFSLLIEEDCSVNNGKATLQSRKNYANLQIDITMVPVEDGANVIEVHLAGYIFNFDTIELHLAAEDLDTIYRLLEKKLAAKINAWLVNASKAAPALKISRNDSNRHSRGWRR